MKPSDLDFVVSKHFQKYKLLNSISQGSANAHATLASGQALVPCVYRYKIARHQCPVPIDTILPGTLLGMGTEYQPLYGRGHKVLGNKGQIMPGILHPYLQKFLAKFLYLRLCPCQFLCLCPSFCVFVYSCLCPRFYACTLSMPFVRNGHEPGLQTPSISWYLCTM